MNRYQLADGSYSDQYKIGDKFVVVCDEHYQFNKGVIVEFEEDDQSSAPNFKHKKASEVSCKWGRLAAYKERSIIKVGASQVEELEAKIDNLEEYISELVKENDQMRELLHERESLKQQANTYMKLSAVLTTHPSFRQNEEHTRREELVNTVKALQFAHDWLTRPNPWK
jgi:hypothetical protein